jgi:hypothetical protein
MGEATPVQRDILAMPAVEQLLYTDGDGRLVAVLGREDGARPRLHERIDVAVAAIDALGRAGGFGALRSAVLRWEGALIAVAELGAGRVGVVARPEVNLGLLLSQLRLLAQEGT